HLLAFRGRGKRARCSATGPSARFVQTKGNKQTARRVSAPGLAVWASVCHRRPPGRRQADFLFFLSSSTSVNSASTTSSFCSPLGPSEPVPAAPPPPPPPA